MEKSCKKCAPKASPRPLFNFGKKPQIAIVYEKGLSKTLKKVNFLFSSETSPF